jgi:hypothetical protein
MKKTITTFVMLFASVAFLLSQNLQLHYDFRHSLDKNNPIERNFAVATFEMFKPDKLGSTFLFVDFDFSGKRSNLNGIYTEIARSFKIKDFPLMPHIEFNGGVGFGYVVENAYMAGAEYTFELGNFFFNPYLVYKYHNFSPKASHDAQISLVWEGNILKDKVTIRGCADLWSENRRGEGETGKKLVFYTEPQFWYNITKHFAVGTEVKISKNFEYFTKKIKFYPTLGIKYDFN